MTCLPQVTTFFTLSDEHLDPAAVTARIGLEPTKSRAESVRTATIVPSGEPYIRPPFWRLELTKEAIDYTDVGLQRLLDILWPQRDAIAELLAETGWVPNFGTNVTITHDPPVYGLSADTIERLAFFKGEYGFDIFDYSED